LVAWVIYWMEMDTNAFSLLILIDNRIIDS